MPQTDVNKALKFIMKMGVQYGRGSCFFLFVFLFLFFFWGGGCQGGCERRIEVFVKIQKTFGGRVGWGGGGGGGQDGCERRIEVFMKIQKKSGAGVGSWGSGWGEGSVWM